MQPRMHRGSLLLCGLLRTTILLSDAAESSTSEWSVLMYMSPDGGMLNPSFAEVLPSLSPSLHQRANDLIAGYPGLTLGWFECVPVFLWLLWSSAT